MSNQYRIIEESTWPRAMHCEVFRGSVEPAFCVTCQVDVTRFRRRMKAQGLSFTLAMVYAVCRCANQVEAFRCRFREGRVVLYDKIDTAFTYLPPGEELFKVVNVPLLDTLEDYVALASQTAREQTACFTGPLGEDVFQCSPLPWLSYTHISHTNSGKKEQATPLFDWGKYSKRDGRYWMPLSIQAHHSFVDGIHVARFVEKLQAYLDRDPALELYQGCDRVRETGALFQEYTDMLVEGDPGFQAYLDLQNYDDELAHLEKKYGPPHGRLFLAYYAGELAGCIGLRRLDEARCEMKRLYVRPKFRGKCIGEALVETLLGEARSMGYTAMLLDTLPFLQSALKLYRRFGFYEIESYNDSPLDTSIYMKADLT